MKTSVLINTFEHRRYLGTCLDSVFGQTQPPDEVIVYDDGSADGSVELLRSRKERFTLIAGPKVAGRSSQENQAHAIHQAFVRATGELVFLLDGDDYFLPEKIARHAAAFASGASPVLVQAPVYQVDECDRRRPYAREAFRLAPDPLAAVYARHDPDLFFPTSALVFSREFLSRALPLDTSDGIGVWSDVRLTCAALLAGRIVSLDEPLTAWRRHGRALTLGAGASRSYLLKLTWRRTRVFNRLARAAGRPPVSIWRNRRFYLQLARWLFPWGGDAAARWGRQRGDRGH